MKRIMTNECWKFIDGYSSYMVSSYGNILNIKRGKTLSPSVRCGYRYIVLSLNGKATPFKCARLTAKAFLPNPCGYPVVNHKDEDKVNDYYVNLEWCTEQYNREYSSSKEYIFCDPLGNKVEVFNLRKFCRDNSLSQGCMVKLHRTGHRHKGWTAWIN